MPEIFDIPFDPLLPLVSGASAVTQAIARALPHAIGDLQMVMVITNSTANHTSSTANWSQLDTRSSFGYRASLWKNESPSANELPLTVAFGSTARYATLTFKIPGGVLKSPLNISAITQRNEGTKKITMGNATTDVDNTINLHCGFAQWGSRDWVTSSKANEIFCGYNNDVSASGPGLMAAWTYQKTLGAMETFDFSCLYSVANAIGFDLFIELDAGVVLPTPPATEESVILVDANPRIDSNGILPQVLNNPTTAINAGGGVDGLTAVYQGSTNTIFGSNVSRYWHAQNAINNSAGDCLTNEYEYSGHGPYDITNGDKYGVVLQLESRGENVAAETISNWGLGFGFRSGTGDYALLQGSGNDADGAGFPTMVVVDSGTIIGHEVGSFDWSDLRASLTLGTTISSSYNLLRTFGGILKQISISGGYADYPASWDTAYRKSLTNKLPTIKKLGSTYEFKQDVILGGAEDAYIRMMGQSFTTPNAANATNKNVEYQAGTGVKIEVNFPSAASDVVIDTPIIFGQPGIFNIKSTSHAGANFSLDGCLISNVGTWDIEADIYTFGGFSIVDCADMDNLVLDLSGGGSIARTKVIIDGATDAEIQTKIDRYANCVGLFDLDINATFAGDIQIDFEGMKIGNLNYSSTQAASDLSAVLNNSTIATYSVDDDETISPSTPINLTLQGVLSGRPYRVYNVTDDVVVQEGTGSGSDIVIPFTLSGKTIECLSSIDQGNRVTQTITTGSSDVPINMSGSTNPFRTISDAAALALTGITVTGDASISYTSTKTIQQVYDYLQAWGNTATGLAFDIPMSTADGTTMFLSSSYTHQITGRVSDESKEWSGTFSIGTGGFFEDQNGAIWESAGTTFYGSHVYMNIKNDLTNANIENCIVAFVESGGSTDQTFTTGLVNEGLISDSSGNVEGYCVWRRNATTYPEHKQYVGEYSFNWSTIPRAVAGLPIGSAASRSNIRLSSDANVSLTKTAALAVAGITVDHSLKIGDLSDETNQSASDNLKARQARKNDIETGMPGYMSFHDAGLIINSDGSFFNGLSDWRYRNLGGAGVWKTGTIELDTPGLIDLDANAVTFDYIAAGTYDHRSNNLSGAITVDTSNDSTVVHQSIPSVSVTNLDAGNITIDQSENFVSTVEITPADSEWLAADAADTFYRVLYVNGADAINTADAVTVGKTGGGVMAGDNSDVTTGKISLPYSYDENSENGLTAATDKACRLVMGWRPSSGDGLRLRAFDFNITRNATVSVTADMEVDYNANSPGV